VIDFHQVLLIFFLCTDIQTGAGTHQSSCKIDTGDYGLAGVKLITKFYILPTLEMCGVSTGGTFASFTFIRIPANAFYEFHRTRRKFVKRMVRLMVVG